MTEHERRIAREVVKAYVDGRGIETLSSDQDAIMTEAIIAWVDEEEIQRLLLLPFEVLRDIISEVLGNR